MGEGFVHLHVASAYSMRYGVAHPRELAARAAELGMPALALTDRDGVYGAVKHIQACTAVGIAPILGAELAVPGGRVSVLASGRRGWRSLCRLVSTTHLTGERGRPVTSLELVAAHADGLIVLLDPRSDVGRALAARHDLVARQRLRHWRESCEVVVEIVDHHAHGDTPLAARLLRLAGEERVTAVLTNAVRLLDPADAPVAQVLDAARRLAPLHLRHLEQANGEAYLKSGKEMTRLAERVCGPDRDAVRGLLAATRRLAARCVLDPAADLGMGEIHLPEIWRDAARSLRQRCAAGLTRRGLADDRRARERLAAELTVIDAAGLAPYFLTVADVTDLVRGLGIRCAARGSGAGSLVNYLIGISEVDPLAHGLLMERFLSEGRPGLPDIDLDVESARRLDAYRVILDRYGHQRCACVSMIETYRARGAIREVGAAVGLPPHEIDAIAKAFPHIRARQIRAALADLPELRASRLDQARLAGLFRLAERLDGLPRHIALHPCGVLLSNATLLDRTPVEKSLLDFPMSQFDKDDVEEMGLIKLDVIGVRMQSAMAYALKEIARVERTSVDLDTIPYDDAATYRLIGAARTLGCFQIESPGQRELVAKLEPRDLHDLIVDISLFRPGPVNSDMVTPYLEVRHGWRAPSLPHPDLARILRETGGVVVFHEQVLRIIDRMTGCGLAQAERARRRLADDAGKQEVGGWFQAAARAAGYDTATVERVWQVLAAFGAFGFCKAHAASFALPTYQSAWLKRHHTAAFFAGVLTHEPGMYPKRALLDDARHFGVEILPLDVNASGADWRVERLPGGRYGLRVALREVKGISDGEVTRIIAGRPYHSLPDFWRRAGVSRPVVERLVLVGGFDAVHDVGPTPRPCRSPGRLTRRDLLAQVGALARVTAPRAASGQLPLGVVERLPPGELPEMTPAEAVEAELDTLGLDVSRHVLSFYDELLDALGVVRARDLLRCRSGSQVFVAGVKIATQTPAVRSGQRIIFLTLDDATGPVDVTFFESVQGRCAATVFGAWLLAVRGAIRRTGDHAISLRALDCWDLVELHQAWRAGGSSALHALLRPTQSHDDAAVGGTRLGYPNGYRLSPYSDIAVAGSPVRYAPRRLWHASGGSSGGWLPAPSSSRRPTTTLEADPRRDNDGKRSA